MKNKIYGDMRCGEWHYTYKGDKIMMNSFTLAEMDWDKHSDIKWTKDGLPLINGKRAVYKEKNRAV